MNAPKRYTANPMVSCGDEEDGAFLFNPDTDDTAIVNLSGRALWALLADSPRTVDEMAAHLVAAYRDVSTEQAAEDAAQFVQALAPDFVLEIGDEG
jgi:hypothetical protein